MTTQAPRGGALLRRERSAGELVEWNAVPRRLVRVWGALFMNVLTFYGVPILVPNQPG